MVIAQVGTKARSTAVTWFVSGPLNLIRDACCTKGARRKSGVDRLGSPDLFDTVRTKPEFGACGGSTALGRLDYRQSDLTPSRPAAETDLRFRGVASLVLGVHRHTPTLAIDSAFPQPVMALGLRVGQTGQSWMGRSMAKSGDWRETKSPEDAAAETDEPEEATRVRAEDDAETRARQDQAEAGLREADRTLEDGGARLRQTKAALRERERELARTGKITREVAESAADLREQTAQIVQEARRSTPRSDSDVKPEVPKLNDEKQ